MREFKTKDWRRKKVDNKYEYCGTVIKDKRKAQTFVNKYRKGQHSWQKEKHYIQGRNTVMVKTPEGYAVFVGKFKRRTPKRGREGKDIINQGSEMKKRGYKLEGIELWSKKRALSRAKTLRKQGFNAQVIEGNSRMCQVFYKPKKGKRYPKGRGKPVSTGRYFGKNKYTLYKIVKSKSKANEIAKKNRSRYEKARVVKLKNRYAVYTN